MTNHTPQDLWEHLQNVAAFLCALSGPQPQSHLKAGGTELAPAVGQRESQVAFL